MNLQELLSNKEAIDQSYQMQYDRVLEMNLQAEEKDKMLTQIESIYEMNLYNLKMLMHSEAKDI
tara:strand:+ start:1461 stop:1652 length:192 start_codon:yes stop_codon:yes gene_type:complete